MTTEFAVLAFIFLIVAGYLVQLAIWIFWPRKVVSDPNEMLPNGWEREP